MTPWERGRRWQTLAGYRRIMAELNRMHREAAMVGDRDGIAAAARLVGSRIGALSLILSGQSGHVLPSFAEGAQSQTGQGVNAHE